MVSAPLLKTSGEGPAAGTLLIGRLLDADELNRVSSVVRFPLALQPYAQPNPSAELVQAMQTFTAEDPITAIAPAKPK